MTQTCPAQPGARQQGGDAPGGRGLLWGLGSLGGTEAGALVWTFHFLRSIRLLLRGTGGPLRWLWVGGGVASSGLEEGVSRAHK